MNALVNVGLLLQKVREKGCHGFSDAAAICRTSPKNFHKLMRGEVPRLDALQRICVGLGITETQLIVGAARAKPEEPRQIVELKKSV